MKSEVTIESLKARITELESENRLPWWKRVYADSILEKMTDFMAVKQNDSSKILGERLWKWLDKQSQYFSEKKEKSENLNFEGIWKKESLQDDLERIRLRIENSKVLFPGFESSILEKEIKHISKLLSAEKLSEARTRLFRLREKVVSRIQRSLRAKRRTLQNSPTWESLRKNSIGIYNSRRILQDVFAHVSSSDSLWIEDFLNAYGNLFRLEERFQNADKSKYRSKKSKSKRR